MQVHQPRGSNIQPLVLWYTSHKALLTTVVRKYSAKSWIRNFDSATSATTRLHTIVHMCRSDSGTQTTRRCQRQLGANMRLTRGSTTSTTGRQRTWAACSRTRTRTEAVCLHAFGRPPVSTHTGLCGLSYGSIHVLYLYIHTYAQEHAPRRRTKERPLGANRWRPYAQEDALQSAPSRGTE